VLHPVLVVDHFALEMPVMVRKIWSHAFCDEARAVEQAEQASDSEYAQRAAQRFLSEYRGAKGLVIPDGYAFRGLDGQLSDPHLMQRLIASQVQTKRRLGNGSGTGAGKTRAAVLASRVSPNRETVGPGGRNDALNHAA
jgi:hypothetical protein